MTGVHIDAITNMAFKYPKIPTSEMLALQKKLAITPKTASMLLQAVYKDYRALRDASPNIVLRKFQMLPGMSSKIAENYRRPLRRMVWLATQDEPEAMAKKTSHCSFWTVKGLAERGIWMDGYDDLTG